MKRVRVCENMAAGLGAVVDEKGPMIGGDDVSKGPAFLEQKARERQAYAIGSLASGAALTGLALYIHKKHPAWAGLLGFLGVSGLVTGTATLATKDPA